MNITSSADVPDSSYFRTQAAEPRITNGGIVILDGKGSRRSSWGSPGVSSTIVLNDDDFCAIHVGFHHKYKGGQFWRYYTVNNGTIERVEWRSLSDNRRQKIIKSYNKYCGGWVKSPGKLRIDYKKRENAAKIAYKLVEQNQDGTLESLYSAEEYIIGKCKAEKAQENQRGGYYACINIKDCLLGWQNRSLVPKRCYDERKILALIEVKIHGTIINYSDGKLAATYLTPLEVIYRFEYSPNHVLLGDLDRRDRIGREKQLADLCDKLIDYRQRLRRQERLVLCEDAAIINQITRLQYEISDLDK